MSVRTGGRSARVKGAVLSTTLDLLAETGLEALSIAAVAARAGVHESSIYRRWQTKEALVVAAIYQQVAVAIALPDSGSVRGDLIEVVNSALHFLRSPAGNAVVRASLALPPSAEANALRRAFWNRRLPEAVAILARGEKRGEIAPGMDHRFMFETIIGYLHARVFVLDDPDDHDVPDRIVNLVLRSTAP